MTNWNSTETMGQEFDRATGKNARATVFEANTRSALISLRINLESSSEHPDNDFSPLYKLTRDDARKKGPNGVADANHNLLDNLENLKQIRFLSVERNGTTHDFPIRIERPTGLSKAAALFNKTGEHPVIIVTGLDGKERAFHVDGDGRPFHEEKSLRATEPIAVFITKELARKPAPPAPQRPSATP